MLQKFQQHINKEFPFLVETKIGIAISGGMDSVVLTHLMQQSSFAISLVHCNFKLRKKESDTDEIFVKQLALLQHSIKLYVFHVSLYPLL